MPETTFTTHVVQHRTTVSAPADVLYELIADVTRWPLILGPTVHVERLESDGSTELLRLWATANGQVRTWVSLRTLDPVARRITFRQQEPAAPVALMGGAWTVVPLGPARTEIVLDHDFGAVDDDPDAVRWISEATEHNSVAELAAMKEIAETRAEIEDRTLTFDDSVLIAGDRAEVYEFLYRAQRWPERIPHVSRLELTEQTPGLQLMDMDTGTADGATHTTRSVRVCFPDRRIVYKQIKLPALLAAHLGEWTLEEVPDGVLARSRHTVTIKPDAVAPVLGDQATVDDALHFVRTALSRNSTTTLHHAKEHAESVGARLP